MIGLDAIGLESNGEAHIGRAGRETSWNTLPNARCVRNPGVADRVDHVEQIQDLGREGDLEIGSSARWGDELRGSNVKPEKARISG